MTAALVGSNFSFATEDFIKRTNERTEAKLKEIRKVRECLDSLAKKEYEEISILQKKHNKMLEQFLTQLESNPQEVTRKLELLEKIRKVQLKRLKEKQEKRKKDCLAKLEKEGYDLSFLEEGSSSAPHLPPSKVVHRPLPPRKVVVKFSDLSYTQRDNPELVTACLQSDKSMSFSDLPYSMRENEKVAIAALKNLTSMSFSDLPYSMRENEKVAIAALENLSSMNFSDLPYSMRENESVLVVARKCGKK